MKHILVFTVALLFFFRCSFGETAQVVDEKKIESQKPIDWEKELFGVGFYGTHPDSLDKIWYSFPINEKAVEPIEGHPKAQYNSLFNIEGDTLKMYNRVFYEYFKKYNPREDEAAVLSKRKIAMQDSSSFILKWIDSSYFKLNKIKGHSLVPEELYIQLSSPKLDPKFKHLEIRTGFASVPSDIQLFSYPDTTFLVMKCFYCDSMPEHSTTQLKSDEIEFVHSFINTLIKIRENGRRSSIICTLGYSYDMTLVYDSLVFKYDNFSIFPIRPDILHQFFSNTIDISRFTPLKGDLIEFQLKNTIERSRSFRSFEKGNDLVDTALVQAVPTVEEIKAPEPIEENKFEFPNVLLSDSLK